MSTLYLMEENVEQLLDMPSAIDAVEEAFSQMAKGRAVNVPRVRAQAPGIVLHSMSAAAEYLGLVGWKQYTTTRERSQFLVGIHNGQTGDLLALIQANRLGQLRTGATSGVAIRHLAAPEAHQVGLIGSGWQAESQLAAVCAVRNIRRAFVYSRNSERREAFAETMSARLGIEVEPVDRPRSAVEGLPIVTTATTSSEPVFHGEDLASGTLVCAVGSNWIHKTELDDVTVSSANNIVCDSVEACRNEAGDLVQAHEKGIFDWHQAIDLTDVVAGRRVGRSTQESIVVFKSVGLAIEDVALAATLLERARQQGVGRNLDI